MVLVFLFFNKRRLTERVNLAISVSAVFIVAAVGAGSRVFPDDKDAPDHVKQDVETFEAAYSLAEGEVLVRIAPPFMPERLVYYRSRHSSQAQAIPKGPDTMFFRWSEKTLTPWGMSFGGGDGIEVRSMLRMLAGIYPQEVEGDQLLLDTRISGDFVLRSDAPRDDVVASMEAILRDEPKLPVRLRFRDVKRRVYVLSGQYKFAALPGYPDSVQIYGDKLVSNSGAGGGAGDVDEFVRWVGMWIERPVVGEIENAPARLSWRYHMPSPSTPQERAAAKNAPAVLRNLEEQTGLTYSEEERETRVLFVEREK